MTEQTNDVSRWAAMQDAVNRRDAESRERAKLRQADSKRSPKVGPDPDYGVTNDDLDAMPQRRAEDLLEQQIAGEMAFARLVGRAPSLMAELQKLKDAGRV